MSTFRGQTNPVVYAVRTIYLDAATGNQFAQMPLNHREILLPGNAIPVKSELWSVELTAHLGGASTIIMEEIPDPATAQ